MPGWIVIAIGETGASWTKEQEEVKPLKKTKASHRLQTFIHSSRSSSYSNFWQFHRLINGVRLRIYWYRLFLALFILTAWGCLFYLYNKN